MSKPYRTMEVRRPCTADEHDLGVLLVNGEPLEDAERCTHCGMVRLFEMDGWTDWFEP